MADERIRIGSHASPRPQDESRPLRSGVIFGVMALATSVGGLAQLVAGHFTAVLSLLALATLLGWLARQCVRDGDVQRAWLDGTVLTVDGLHVQRCDLARAVRVRLGWTAFAARRTPYRVLIVRQESGLPAVRFVLRGTDLSEIPSDQLRMLADAIGDRSAYHDRSARVPRRLRELADEQDAIARASAVDWTFRTDPKGERRSPQ
jgi:hypothetical protein